MMKRNRVIGWLMIAAAITIVAAVILIAMWQY